MIQPPPQIRIDHFLELEKAVWRALCEGDGDADDALLADDFLGVYPSGRAGKSDHVGQLRDGPAIATFSLGDAQAMMLAEDVVLLSYRAEFVRTTPSGQGEPEAMYVSSIWRKAGEAWRNVFSQDTPATP